jgi:hypothetical protein
MNMEEIFNDHHWETSFAQWLMHLIALQPERSKQLPFQFWPDSCVSTFDHQQFAFIPQLRSAVVPTPVGDVDAFATQLQVCAALRYPRPSLSGMCGSSAVKQVVPTKLNCSLATKSQANSQLVTNSHEKQPLGQSNSFLFKMYVDHIISTGLGNLVPVCS